MELQTLYDLQERLEAAAAAGVRLAGEDFRLKRAVDSIAPLADASPVIKKLYLMAAQTIAPDCKDRAGTLLDTLALSEAILCTQAGCGVPGTLVPLAAILPLPALPGSKTSSGGPHRHRRREICRHFRSASKHTGAF